MRVAVIIPCYNYGRFLDEAVRSVLSQTRPADEIVVIDDGSTDRDTLSLLDQAPWEGVQVQRIENVGAAEARNLAASDTTSEVLSFVDADDVLDPQFLAKTVPILESDKDERVGFVTTWLTRFGNEDSLWKSPLDVPAGWSLGCPAHIASPILRSAFERAGRFRSSEKGALDWDFWLRVLAAGYEGTVVKESLYRYRRHGPSSFDDFLQDPIASYRDLVTRNLPWFQENALEVMSALFGRSQELETAWANEQQALSEAESLNESLRREHDERLAVVAERSRLEARVRELAANLQRVESAREEASTYAKHVQNEKDAVGAHANKLEKALEDASTALDRLWLEKDAIWQEKNAFLAQVEAQAEKIHRLESELHRRTGLKGALRALRATPPPKD